MASTRHNELWDKTFQKISDFIDEHRRMPSKHKRAEHHMFNWIKHNKKLYSRQEMLEHRIERFEDLLERACTFRRINQYAYVDNALNILSPPENPIQVSL